MKLYLSSFLLGNDPGHLVRLAGGRGARCALVLNALDNAPEAREQFEVSQTAALTGLGFAVRQLDLRSRFPNPERLADDLRDVDLLWITGDNAFILREAMRQSGLDTLLPELLSRDEIVYAGFSAAAVIASADLKGLTPSAASHAPLPGYDAGLVWEGLGIVPFAIVVHHASDHPGRTAAAAEERYYDRHGVPHRLLRDGEMLVVDGADSFVTGWPDTAARRRAPSETG